MEEYKRSFLDRIGYSLIVPLAAFCLVAAIVITHITDKLHEAEIDCEKQPDRVWVASHGVCGYRKGAGR